MRPFAIGLTAQQGAIWRPEVSVVLEEEHLLSRRRFPPRTCLSARVRCLIVADPLSARCVVRYDLPQEMRQVLAPHRVGERVDESPRFLCKLSCDCH